MARSNPVDIECKILRQNASIMVIDAGEVMKVPGANGELKEKVVEVVLPISQVEDNGDGTITIPEWLAVDRGLV